MRPLVALFSLLLGDSNPTSRVGSGRSLPLSYCYPVRLETNSSLQPITSSTENVDANLKSLITFILQI
uniref:Uncharacterized protein n=1 Tax=Solanum tuberosum TaxID=4113 RepID=M1CH78_SOLTU